MGHTLVTRFDSQSSQFLHSLMQPFNANKVPFGRDCDREAANTVLDYHVTLFHWAKNQDAYYLDCIKDIKPVPCQIQVTGTQIMRAEEGSWLLYFPVSPAQGFTDLTASVEANIHTYCSGFLHITLAVSKNREEIEAINRHIRNNVTFPFYLNVEGLDLYHIWKPTRKVRSF